MANREPRRDKHGASARQGDRGWIARHASIARRRSRVQPPEGSRAAEVFRDDHVWIRFAARPTSGPQAPHDRDEFYIVASGTARYRWDGGETMIGPGDMMFADAHTPHGYDQFSEDFSVWVIFYGPQKPVGNR
jgi:mannose-6-phosphate isomerase-like protein (cupin superfamily)